ncbi:hypothetical protein FHW79_006487 [Azospirillum sp. OGB3]|uniref:hypothetical protein n=1 Tax=Azospirillum sp. OGB3 TaxID=2587012 RepID=UPI001605FC4F|nr:hypothetical protein [Azospirillum sp. OGB3]MBB3268811.1 hypothetical protein [Azospirillum sp. OGB3]
MTEPFAHLYASLDSLHTVLSVGFWIGAILGLVAAIRGRGWGGLLMLTCLVVLLLQWGVFAYPEYFVPLVLVLIAIEWAGEPREERMRSRTPTIIRAAKFHNFLTADWLYRHRKEASTAVILSGALFAGMGHETAAGLCFIVAFATVVWVILDDTPIQERFTIAAPGNACEIGRAAITEAFPEIQAAAEQGMHLFEIADEFQARGFRVSGMDIRRALAKAQAPAQRVTDDEARLRLSLTLDRLLERRVAQAVA